MGQLTCKYGWLRDEYSYRDLRRYMMPLAKILAARGSVRPAEIYDLIADEVGVTEEERQAMPDSGGSQAIYRNRIQFARQSLIDACLVRPLSEGRRGVWEITAEGKQIVGEEKDDRALHDRLLRAAHQGMVERKNARKESRRTAGLESAETEQESTDAESDRGEGVRDAHEIQAIIDSANDATYSELLEIVQSMDETKFEHLAGDVLKAALRATAVRITPPTRDEGIDGILSFDDLGTRRVVFQAKRYQGHVTVGRPEIDQFAAARQRARADYGVFVTTSRFSSGATEAARDFGIRLVDGNALVELMAKHSIGVRTVASFALYEVDVTWSQDLGD